MKKMSLKRREDPLWNSPDPVLRRVHRGRTYIGRLLVLVTLLFVGMNLQLFTPASIGNIRSSLKAASVRSAEDMTVISYPSGSSKSILPFGNGLAVELFARVTIFNYFFEFHDGPFINGSVGMNIVV